MSRPPVNFNFSGNSYPQQGTITTQAQRTFIGQTQPVTSTYTTANVVNQPTNVRIVQGQTIRSQLYGGNYGQTTTQGYNSGNNYGYGYSNGNQVRRQVIESPTINYNTSNVVYQAPRTSTIVGQKPVAFNYNQSVVQPVITSTRVETVTQPRTTVITSPPVYFNQPQEQRATNVVVAEPVKTQWIQEDIERPKYSKLYNASTQHYRDLAPEEDPIVKKTCCSPCCWVLWGLLGLLALLFGILCGLGVLCGGVNLSAPSIGLPSINGPNLSLPTIQTPSINIPTPSIETPAITFPTITTPTITTPTITTPSVEFDTIQPVFIQPITTTRVIPTTTTQYYTTSSTGTTGTTGITGTTGTTGTAYVNPSSVDTTTTISGSEDSVPTNYVVTDIDQPYVEQPNQ